jgi:hypothetical protein
MENMARYENINGEKVNLNHENQVLTVKSYAQHFQTNGLNGYIVEIDIQVQQPKKDTTNSAIDFKLTQSQVPSITKDSSFSTMHNKSNARNCSSTSRSSTTARRATSSASSSMPSRSPASPSASSRSS